MPKRFPYAKGISTVCMVNEVGIQRIYQFLAIRVLGHEVEKILVYIKRIQQQTYKRLEIHFKLVVLSFSINTCLYF